MAIWRALFFSLSLNSLCFFFHTHTLSPVYVGGVCERDCYLADCFVRGANKALRLIPSFGRRPHAHCTPSGERIMGGPVLLAQYKCRPLSRRQIKLSARYVKARAPKECEKAALKMRKKYSRRGSLFAVRFNSLLGLCVPGNIAHIPSLSLPVTSALSFGNNEDQHPEEFNNVQKAPGCCLFVTPRGRPAIRTQLLTRHGQDLHSIVFRVKSQRVYL